MVRKLCVKKANIAAAVTAQKAMAAAKRIECDSTLSGDHSESSGSLFYVIGAGVQDSHSSNTNNSSDGEPEIINLTATDDPIVLRN